MSEITKKMKPGKELDALIAEKVMGLTKEGQLRCAHNPSFGVKEWYEIPSYSTDISAAWEVVDKLQQQDYGIILDNMMNSLGHWQAWFEKDRKSLIGIAEGCTAPHAICLAALKAVGYSSIQISDTERLT